MLKDSPTSNTLSSNTSKATPRKLPTPVAVSSTSATPKYKLDGSVSTTPFKKAFTKNKADMTPLRSTSTKTPLKPFVVRKVKQSSTFPTLASPLMPKPDSFKAKTQKLWPKLEPLKPLPKLEPLVTPINRPAATNHVNPAVLKPKFRGTNADLDGTPTNTGLSSIVLEELKPEKKLDMTNNTQLHHYSQTYVFKFGDVVTRLAPILLFTLDDCLNAQRSGNLELCREMFRMLAELNSSTTCLQFDTKRQKYKVFRSKYNESFEFFSEWLKFEQKSGDYTQQLNVYLQATDNLKSVNDLRKIQDMFNSFNHQQRKITKSEPIIDIDSREDQEFMQRMERVINKEILVDKAEYYTIEELPKSIESENEDPAEKKKPVEDIAEILGNLTLETSVKRAPAAIIEDDFRYSIQKKDSKPGKTMVGVNMGTSGSTVTVLTPIKAKKKQQLG